MLKYLSLLLLLSCNQPVEDKLYHSLDTNIFCKEYFKGSTYQGGVDCYSLVSGKKFKAVHNLTNVVRVK